MTVRAKFVVESIERIAHGSLETHTIKMRAVTGGTPENESFWRWTPSGQIILQCTNPEASEQLTLGGEFYVDFTKVPE